VQVKKCVVNITMQAFDSELSSIENMLSISPCKHLSVQEQSKTVVYITMQAFDSASPIEICGQYHHASI